METNKWVINETEKDIEKSGGISLRQENYTLPILRIPFGTQELLVPQIAMSNYLATCMTSMSIKECIYASQMQKVREIYGFSKEDSVFYTAEQLSEKREEFKQKVLQIIEKRLEEEGPYVMLREMFDYSYHNGAGWEIDAWLTNTERPFSGKLGIEEDDYDSSKEEKEER